MSDHEDPPDRLLEIFNEANAMPPGEERDRFVSGACGDDSALRDEVAALLAAHGRAGEFMFGGPGEAGTIPFSAAKARDRIGRYTLLEQIGEGGFGVVWVAEQTQPVKRRVALKIIKPGMDSGQVIARFEAERQALALMDHPNIARVLDAGTTDAGRPYFVMELIHGVSITRYCDKKLLTPRQRLELFVPVCQAVQHAHQKGIIHRDLKPSNVLVALYDGKPVPKIIDFGVAKATGPTLTEATLYTQFGQVVGTPEYMSPEQAELDQLDIDTRSDIYSLGVLLYELLTGTTPLDRKRLKEAALLEILRIIREEEPPKPSTRLSSSDSLASVAAHCSLEPAKLTKLVRVDLDWIVMKALEKDRNRRYETANGLALDVQRYLADEPVLACPPSAWYRMHKFVRRNKLPALATAAVVAALVAGVIGTTIGLIGESRQRALAETERGEALRQKTVAEDARVQTQGVVDFLTEDVLAATESHRLRDKAVRDQILKVMIDPAAEKVAERFKDKPTVEAAVRQTLVQVYESIGRADLALPHAREALAIRRRTLGDPHPDTLRTLNSLGSVLRSTGNLDEAEPVSREALAANRQTRGDDHLETIESMTGLALVLYARGKGTSGEAEPLLREALERSRRAHGDDAELTVMSLNNLGWYLQASGQLDEAEPLLLEAVDRGRRALGEDYRGTIRAINNMGVLRQAQGRLTESEQFRRESLELSRRVLGDDHPETVQVVSDMGTLLTEQGKFDEAEPLFREALERRKRVLTEDHPDTVTSLYNLGAFLMRWGKLDEAEPLMHDALARNRRVLSEDHPNTLYTLLKLGDLRHHQKMFDEAEKLYRDVLERAGRVLPADDVLATTAMYSLGSLLHSQNKPEVAEPLLRDVLVRRRKSLGDTHVETVYTARNLATLLMSQRKLDDAELLLRQVLSDHKQAISTDSAPVAGARIDLGLVLIELARYGEAETELLEADRVYALPPGVSTRRRERCCQALVRLYDAWEASDPGKGYDAKAATWRAKLPKPPPQAPP